MNEQEIKSLIQAMIDSDKRESLYSTKNAVSHFHNGIDSPTLPFQILFGNGAPTISALKGTLYVNKTAATTTTRLYINTDGNKTWAYFTASA